MVYASKVFLLKAQVQLLRRYLNTLIKLPYFGLSNTRKILVGLFGGKLMSHLWSPATERTRTMLIHSTANHS